MRTQSHTTIQGYILHDYYFPLAIRQIPKSHLAIIEDGFPGCQKDLDGAILHFKLLAMWESATSGEAKCLNELFRGYSLAGFEVAEGSEVPGGQGWNGAWLMMDQQRCPRVYFDALNLKGNRINSSRTRIFHGFRDHRALKEIDFLWGGCSVVQGTDPTMGDSLMLSPDFPSRDNVVDESERNEWSGSLRLMYLSCGGNSVILCPAGRVGFHLFSERRILPLFGSLMEFCLAFSEYIMLGGDDKPLVPWR